MGSFSLDKSQLAKTKSSPPSPSCVIAELFLEGKHLFELGELLSYVKGEYDPAPRLRRIGDAHIEALVTHMIQRDPALRVSAEEYLHRRYVLVSRVVLFH